nr:MAG TPA: hypothetical protein [Caudoviricetes sp.]
MSIRIHLHNHDVYIFSSFFDLAIDYWTPIWYNKDS